MKTLALLTLCGGLAALTLNANAAPAGEAAAPRLDDVERRAETALARPELEPYRGWIKYLGFLARSGSADARIGASEAAERVKRLDDWLARIEADPGLISKLRGVQEWAYESPVDGSGQPFKLVIPTDYDGAESMPLSIYMHGYSGNHLEHSTGMAAHPGFFEMAVLGRARGGWYTALSAADVLQAIDYVQRYWKIDDRRIRLTGGSMGGGATFKLGSRYPQRFASGQITCGYVEQVPVDNLLTFPIYAVHSADDPVVPVLEVRSPLDYLRGLGGEAILDETNGYGHASWNYAEGGRRSGEWAAGKALPLSQEVRRLDYTALDGGAMRSWWAEIAEWGPYPKPARFVLSAHEGNLLQVRVENVARLRLRLDEGPFDRTRPLAVSVDGAVPFSIAAPLPDSVVLAQEGGAWAVERKSPAGPPRLHTPGGPIQAYDGSPLLIVYGTRGDAARRAALKAAAEAAAKSPNPAWLADGGESGSDGVPHLQLLYGHLRAKADTEVSDAELKASNLVLIGTAAENAVVARLAPELPVSLDSSGVRCSDKVAIPASNAMIGLYHFNPLAPERVIFWVASSDPAAYAPGATVPQLCGNFFLGADLLVTSAKDGTLVATRSFDSRWRWLGRDPGSRVLGGKLADKEGLARGIADAVRRAADADYAVAVPVVGLGSKPIVAGQTRVQDLVPLYFNNGVEILTVSGAQLLDIDKELPGLASEPNPCALEPAVNRGAIERTRTYRIALPMAAVFPYGRSTRIAPRSEWHPEIQVDQALERHLGE